MTATTVAPPPSTEPAVAPLDQDSVLTPAAGSPPALDSPPLILPDCADHVVLRVNFEPDSAALDDQDRERITALVATLPSDGPVYIDGHTDERPTPIGNPLLSQLRAGAVADEFERLGVARDRLRPRGYGDSWPLEEGHDSWSWEQNRRTVVSFNCQPDQTPAADG